MRGVVVGTSRSSTVSNDWSKGRDHTTTTGAGEERDASGDY